MAMQEMIGMIGAFVMHPKETYKPRVDKDFVIILQGIRHPAEHQCPTP